MKRRKLLEAGTAVVGGTWLLNNFTAELLSKQVDSKLVETMATSNEQFTVNKTEEQWREQLTPEQFRVLRKHGTERAGSSPLDKVYEPGVFKCSACGTPLFTSDTKFNSGTGWPSFYKPIEGAIATTTDRSFFMTRVEVHCATCGGHLGHVFPDGPEPTGQRYCMNGVSLEFVPEEA
ncbi:peptide-methionine (R)-S-oxide reductase MsrB [Nodosilinea sp. LEGE 07298]|uniref:peptide-methionine (R)-S-oxide reductase MsrB n=1 Tax=Nodosilinea sp. LEGE 07298 TaxID=2777970 RepID=UPI0018818561|nr:peptide-methionine (R)-S-oxide reductase MsrB [Nodosilinea sp. LEGE 07298]MBE9108010.1 peptide-methionine (R)-S-oxide reductase MsrB [Nodosilinea sp. LEGE 07298]